MIPGVEMRVRLDDRLGVAAVTYVLFSVKLGPALALFVVLVFAIWIGWRWLCRNIQQSPLVFRAYQGAAARSPLAHARARAVGVLRLDAMMADAMAVKPGSVERVYGATPGARKQQSGRRKQTGSRRRQHMRPPNSDPRSIACRS
jgi:hypothetical protein